MKTTTQVAALIAAILLFPSILYSQSKLSDRITFSLNSPSGQYAKGDSVKVYAEISEELAEPVKMVVTAAGKVVSNEAVVLKAGGAQLIHTAVWDSPKSVILKLSLESNPKNFTSAGYIVAPEEFTPGYQEPSDMMEFWQDQIKQMRKTRLKAKLQPVTEEYKSSDRIECFSLEINMPEGNPVRAYIAIPRNSEKKSLPIYILAHGAGVSKPHNRSRIDRAVGMAAYGAIAVDVNAHGMLNDQPQAYYDELVKGELKKYSARPLTTREDYYFRLMYLRLIRTLDYLVTREEWDGERVLVQGSSQGGGQAAAIAGLDSRVKAAVLTVPALNDLGGHLQDRLNGWPVRTLYSTGSQKELAGKILPYYDGALLIKHTKAKLFYEAGLVDLVCDPACVFASFNNAGSSDKQIVTFPFRPHGAVSKKYRKVWIAECDKPREQFIKDYLK